jgi:hypothetical protein
MPPYNGLLVITPLLPTLLYSDKKLYYHFFAYFDKGSTKTATTIALKMEQAK